MKIELSESVSSEAWVFLNASAESGTGDPLAVSLSVKGGRSFDATDDEAKYLAEQLDSESERVAEACSPALGRACEQAAAKIRMQLSTVNHPLKGRRL